MHPFRTAALLASLAAAALAALPAAASAHVTLQPEEVPAGAFERLDVRVPNERDDASTTRVQVRFPPGFLFVSHEPVPGWRGEVRMRRLATPVEAFGERRTEEVDTVTYTAEGDGIGPGEFQDFGLSVGLPARPSTLTFKALQTYSGGEVVRWIGPPDADEPAPQVTLTAAEGADPAAHGTAGEEAPAAGAAAGAGSGTGGDDGPGTALVVAALVAGGLGLLAGVAGLVAARRARGGSGASPAAA